MPIYEPGLDELVARQHARPAGFAFATEPGEAVGERRRGVHRRRHADAARRRPCRPELRLCRGRARSPTRSAATPWWSPSRRCRSAPAARSRASSARRQPAAEFDVASNPEFLREGAAIEDFMKPDRVVIGVEQRARARRDGAQSTGRSICIQTPMVFTNIETAEVTKYAGNAFLATKITFINEIADLCEKVGADVHDVARGIGLDGRIGRKFLHPGPGFGGSCFPKDTLALALHRARGRRAADDRRAGDRGQQRAQEAHGRQGHRRSAAARWPARPSACWASPSSPTPTTCATRRRSTSCRPCRRRAPRSWRSIPRA